MKGYLMITFTVMAIVLTLLLNQGSKAASPPDTPNATTTPSPSATAPTCGTLSAWTTQQPLATPVGGVTASSDGTFVYAVDGYDYAAGHTVAQFAKYDPIANTWTSLPSPDNSFYGASAVYAPNTGKLYVFGGYLDNAVPLTTTRIFDFVANTWSSGAPMPASRGGMGAAYGNGKILLVGGDAGGNVFTDQTWAYDPTADTWMTMTAMPAVRVAPAAAVINGHLYAAGGFTSSYQESNSLFDYDIANDSWSSGANMPIGIFGAAAVAEAGRLVIIGGGLPSNAAGQSSDGINAVRNVTLIYDPSTDTWSNGPALNQARSFAGAAAASGYLVVVGGDVTSNAATNSVESAHFLSCETASPTAMPSETATSTPSSATDTPAPATSTPLPQPSPTPTDCVNPFVDIAGNTFYTAIHYLNCRGVIGGTSANTYTPAGTATRAQFAKVVVLGFGLQLYTPAGQPDFTDVPADYFAYSYIESGYHAGILSGFDAATCGNAGVAFPCYLPARPITRAQLTKLVVSAAGYAPFTPTQPTFNDVPPTNIFYATIETAHHMGVINGYADNSFRPNNNIRRDEMAQIVYKGVTTP